MKNESKAIGGRARALKLSPQERSDMAQNAARKRWENHQKIEKVGKEPFKKLRGVAKEKTITVITTILANSLNFCEVEVMEDEKVIRKFHGQPFEQARARIEGYINALQDIGIELKVIEISKAV